MESECVVGMESEWPQCTQSPSKILAKAFQDSILSKSLDNLRDDAKEWSVGSIFQKELDAVEEHHRNVPSLNAVPAELLPAGCFVRFRGMVQDMANPECYMGVYERRNRTTGQSTIDTMKYRDLGELLDEEEVSEDRAIMYERLPVFVTSVPAESDWVHRHDVASHASANVPQKPVGTSKTTPTKRPLDSDSNDMAVDSDDTSKRAKAENTDSSKPSQAPTALAIDNRPCYLVKVYDEMMEKVKLNDVIEFFGILSHPVSGTTLGGDPFEDAPGNPTEPPAPTIHALAYRTLINYNPYTTHFKIGSLERTKAVTEARAAMPQLRKEMITYLSSVLGGDELAAEYVLLHLLSSVYARRADLALGKLSINLTNSPNDSGTFARVLETQLSKFLPRCSLFGLSRDKLVEYAFSPKRDVETMRIQPSVLQVAVGTELIIDETQLSPGQISQQGIENLQALAILIQTQKVWFDWTHYKTEMPADVGVLVLSEGKSIFPVDCVIPLLKHAQPLQATPPPAPSEEWFARCAAAITLCKETEFRLDAGDVAQSIEQEFVRRRQENPKLTPESLHLWLTLSRLLCLSFGLDALNRSHWDYVLDLERRRLERSKS